MKKSQIRGQGPPDVLLKIDKLMKIDLMNPEIREGWSIISSIKNSIVLSNYKSAMRTSFRSFIRPVDRTRSVKKESEMKYSLADRQPWHRVPLPTIPAARRRRVANCTTPVAGSHFLSCQVYHLPSTLTMEHVPVPQRSLNLIISTKSAQQRKFERFHFPFLVSLYSPQR